MHNNIDKSDFNFFVSVDGEDLEKASKKDKKSGRYDNMRIKGVASDSSEDTDSEILEPKGFELSRFLQLGTINYDHRLRESPKFLIGEPVSAKIIDDKFHVEAELYKESETARDVWDTMIMLKAANSSRHMGFSIEGKSLERDPQNAKRVTKALITGLAVTMSPKNANSYADIVKGKYVDSYVKEYKYIDEEIQSLEKSEANGGKITYLVDIMDEESGIRYTVDKDLKLKVTKSMSTETAKPLIKEDLEDKVKVLTFEDKKKLKKIKKAVDSGIIKRDVLVKAVDNLLNSKQDSEAYKNIKKAFVSGDIDYNTLIKARSKELQSKHPNSSWKTINGAHVLVGSGGNVIAGAGGKLDGGGEKGKTSSSDKKVLSHLDKQPSNYISFGVNKGDMKKLLTNDDSTHKWSNDHYNKVEGAVNKLGSQLTSKKESQATRGGEKKESKKESGKKPYHKDDSLNDFRDMAANAKSTEDFMSKLRQKTDVTPAVSKEFFDKYNPSGTLTPESAANKMFNEVKGVGKKGNKTEIPKEVTKTVADMKSLSKESKDLDNSSFTTSTYDYNQKSIDKLAEVSKKLDPKKMSKKNKEKLDNFLDETDRDVYIHGEKNTKHARGLSGGDFENDFRYKESIHERVEMISNQIKKEENIKEKEELTTRQYDKKYGEMYGVEDFLEEAKNMVVKLTGDYVKKQTTDALQHKLF